MPNLHCIPNTADIGSNLAPPVQAKGSYCRPGQGGPGGGSVRKWSLSGDNDLSLWVEIHPNRRAKKTY